jgi:ArsR family transcriptional regulator, arsenate/arsenite/antimonite-responsive transcriptional repressor
MSQNEIVDILKALADPVRLAIVRRLMIHPELSAQNLLEDFKITQPTLSFHMKKLIQSGLITARKEGTWMRYQVNTLMLNSINAILDFTTKTQATLQAYAEQVKKSSK